MDPRRLLDEPGLSELETRVLTAASDAAPTEPVKRLIWSALSAKLPPGGGGPSGGEGPTGLGESAAGAAGAGGLGGGALAASMGGKTMALISIAKAASIGVSLGIVATTAAFTLAPDRSALEPPATPAATSPATPRGGTANLQHVGEREGAEQNSAAGAAAPPEAPGRAPEPVRPMVPAPSTADRTAQSSASPRALGGEFATEGGNFSSSATASVAGFPVARPPQAIEQPRPAPVSSRPTDPAARIDSTASAREESRLVAAARDALRSQNAGRALALLEQTRRQFPRGTLAQEREALSIEALAISGQREAAAQLARRFLNAYPSSMHAARVRSFARLP